MPIFIAFCFTHNTGRAAAPAFGPDGMYRPECTRKSYSSTDPGGEQRWGQTNAVFSLQESIAAVATCCLLLGKSLHECKFLFSSISMTDAITLIEPQKAAIWPFSELLIALEHKTTCWRLASPSKEQTCGTNSNVDFEL
jgi:hypothetical protein